MFLHHSTSFKASSALYPFTTQAFTNAGVTGRYGPNITQCRTAYTASSWTANSLYFNMTTQGYQLWTVPSTGIYNFLIAGSRAGIYPGQSTTGSLGFGASVQARLSLTMNQVITIICGSYTDATTSANFATYQGLGGGGGTFVSNGATLLLAAGGGGGNSLYSGTFLGTSGALATTGRPSICSASYSASLGGIAGSGGQVASSGNSYNGGAGGGWNSVGYNGNTTTTKPYPQTTYSGEGGYTYSNGFYGGDINYSWGNPPTYASSTGGFGGGGGGNGIICGGGGGGYSGGGAGQGGTSATIGNAGGGGGSYIISSATNVGTPNGTFEGISTFNGVAIQNLGGSNFPLYGFNNSSGYVTVTKV